jgi:hypothetical protein
MTRLVAVYFIGSKTSVACKNKTFTTKKKNGCRKQASTNVHKPTIWLEKV